MSESHAYCKNFGNDWKVEGRPMSPQNYKTENILLHFNSE